jgi:hypothetical protein
LSSFLLSVPFLLPLLLDKVLTMHHMLVWNSCFSSLHLGIQMYASMPAFLRYFNIYFRKEEHIFKLWVCKEWTFVKLYSRSLSDNGFWITE